MAQARQGASSGFSLVEMLVVLALMGVLLGLAAPGMSALRQKHQMQSQGERLLSSLLLARTEALRRQQRGTVCSRGADDSCSPEGQWSKGWLVFVDANDNALRDSHETVLMAKDSLPPLVRLSGNAPVRRYVSYGSDGRSQTTTGAFQAGTLTLCVPGQAVIWRIVINAVGKPRLESEADDPSQAC